MLVLQDVNGGEVFFGPFKQVAHEMEVKGQSIQTVLRDATTRDPICYGHAGFFFHDGHPYKTAFTRALSDMEES
jgi:hypothetical protein